MNSKGVSNSGWLNIIAKWTSQKPMNRATSQQIHLPAVTLAAMPCHRVWCWLPGEISVGGFVDEDKLAAAVRELIEKEKR